MHASTNLTHGNPNHGIPRAGVSLLLLLMGCLGVVAVVRSVPEIARRMASPCSGCGLDAFAPPLEPYGFAFRNAAHGGKTPPPAGTADTPAGGTVRWLWPDGTIALGRPPLAGTGLRYTWTANRLEPDGNASGRTNGWNGVPVWSFPDERSALGTLRFPAIGTAGVSAFPDRASQPSSPGPGADASRNGLVAAGGRPYDGAAFAVANPDAGAPAVDGASWIVRSAPAWHVAVQEDLERHFLQIGTYEEDAKVSSDGSRSAGASGTFTNAGADANYQFILDPGDPGSDRLSAHATVIHDALTIGAGSRATGFNTLDTFSAGAAWSIAGTVTPSIEYFRTAGSVGTFQYSWSNGRPNSAGVIAEIAYVPWGVTESPIQFLNLRLSAQYVTYTELSGIGRGGNANNAVYLSLWGALRF